MKKKLVTTLLAGVMAASMVMPALASGTTSGGVVPSGSGTEVWAGIVIEDYDAKVKVEVPTLFAFVVKGTTATGNTTAVQSSNGDIYLPNVKVNVTTPSVGATPGVFDLEYVGTVPAAGKLPFTNYSTYDDSGDRKGLGVTINGNIKNENDAQSRNYWTHTMSTRTTNAATDFKNYNVVIDGQSFDTMANGGLEMATGITLPAPNVDPAGDGSNANLGSDNLAVDGATYNAAFDVLVGGQKSQYSQVEQSAKIGTIVWTVSVEMTGAAGVVTAPNGNYLQP